MQTYDVRTIDVINHNATSMLLIRIVSIQTFLVINCIPMKIHSHAVVVACLS